MDFIKNYGNYIKKNINDNHEKSWKLICTGISANKLRTNIIPNKKYAKGNRKLEHLIIKMTEDAFCNTDKAVWCNVFAPVEIFQAFGLKTFSIESIASFFSGLYCEDAFIDYAQSEGISPTLCSYHKGFIGAVDSKVIPKPKFAVTTSFACDANLNTFRYLAQKQNLDYTLLDIPYESDEEAIKYVTMQLEDLIKELEIKCNKKMDLEYLKEIIRIENETKQYLKEFIELQKDRYYPGSMVTQLYLLMATHLYIGSKEIRDLLLFMKEDIKKYPKLNGKKIFWTHVIPFYQETLRNYFDVNEDYQIVGCDITLDYMEMLDSENPLESLSRKMVKNIFNGPYENKVKYIENLVKELDIDAVINFCHWGCKQASGGNMLLKESMNKLNIPMLTLDGDAIDRRNSHDGQIKTRFEAFLELISEESKLC